MVNDVFGGLGVDSTSAATIRLNEPFMQEVLSATLSMTPTASTKFISPHKLAFVSDLLKQQATKSCLVPSCRWLAKVEELFVQSQLKHGIIFSRINQSGFQKGTEGYLLSNMSPLFPIHQKNCE